MINLKTLPRLAGAFAAFALLVSSLAIPASARDSFVQDGASMFGAQTVTSLNQSISDFNRQTGKEVVVVTVPTLGGEAPLAAAEKVFAAQQVNGVLIFLAKAEKKDGIIPGRTARAFFPAGTLDSIRQAMRGYFRTGDYDAGITTGVNLVLDQYRSHENSLGGARQSNSNRQLAPAATSSSSFGGGMSLFFLIAILIAGFLIIRALFRAMSGRNRMMPPGYGGQPGYGQGPGYGGPGYGGGGMGGGGFFSGLLGGLGGAFLGNELFGRNNNQNFGGDSAGIAGGDAGNASDGGGWQSDAGQADTSNASFGDFGSSGGGFDSGGGGGFDGGGGGGFDSGGGGDSGGGW